VISDKFLIGAAYCDSIIVNMGFWPQVQPAAEEQMSLADLETIKVIGKGSGGVVQLVRHKFSNNMYALKVRSFSGLLTSFLLSPYLRSSLNLCACGNIGHMCR
jgi:hypothetical protein